MTQIKERTQAPIHDHSACTSSPAKARHPHNTDKPAYLLACRLVENLRQQALSPR
ncbi:MAG: hypothetical protein SFV17_03055 [Candidatus Obscuribacter sp.]|nr:hypothetical protein [Candidatus Obscuribacter sp.]